MHYRPDHRRNRTGTVFRLLRAGALRIGFNPLCRKLRSMTVLGNTMRSCSRSICAAILIGLAIVTAHAQTAQDRAPSFCPTAVDANSVPSAALPDATAGMAALRDGNYPLAYGHLHPLA